MISPLVTRSIVEIQFNKVVFPEPLEPHNGTNSPLSTDKEILSIALVRLIYFHNILKYC